LGPFIFKETDSATATYGILLEGGLSLDSESRKPLDSSLQVGMQVQIASENCLKFKQTRQNKTAF